MTNWQAFDYKSGCIKSNFPKPNLTEIIMLNLGFMLYIDIFCAHMNSELDDLRAPNNG